MERRPGAEVLARLEHVIVRLEELGGDAEDAAARVTRAIAQGEPARGALAEAIGDVLEVIAERSKLAHEAHRLIELRREYPQGDARMT